MNSERLKILLEQVEKEGNDPFLLYGIAMEYMSANQYETSLEYLLRTVQEFPDYVPSYYQLGVCLDEIDRVDEAIRLMKIGFNLAKAAGDEKAAQELDQYIKNLEFE